MWVAPTAAEFNLHNTDFPFRICLSGKFISARHPVMAALYTAGLICEHNVAVALKIVWHDTC
jgi:hypothetical protein